jgi:hypothetical protein
MELTGANESAARGVFMYVCDQDEVGGLLQENGNKVFGRQEERLREFELDFSASGPVRPWQFLPVAGGA